MRNNIYNNSRNYLFTRPGGYRKVSAKSVIRTSDPRLVSASTEIGAKEWQTQEPRAWKCGIKFKNPKTMSEAEVVIHNGELLCGILDKKHYGATLFGLIHCIFELYGGTTSSKLRAFNKVFQCYLQWIGFTLGIEDILVKTKADTIRTKIIDECKKIRENVHR